MKNNLKLELKLKERFRKLRARLIKILKSRPWWHWALVIIAFVALGLFSFNDPRADLAREVDIHLKNGEPQAARSAAAEFISNRFEDDFGWTMAGNIELEEAEPTTALRYYVQAISRNLENANAFYGVGLATRQLGLLDESIEAFNRSLAIEENATTFTALAFTYVLKGDVEKANDLVSQAEATRKVNAETYVNMAVIRHLGFNFAERDIFLSRAQNMGLDTTAIAHAFAINSTEDILNLAAENAEENNQFAKSLVENIDYDNK